MIIKRIHAIAVVLGLLMIVAGCQSPPKDAPQLAVVKGTVQHAGKAVAGAIVTFYPDGTRSTKGPSASGQTNAEGEFVLTSSANQQGAVVGFHKVTIVCEQMGSRPQSAAPAVGAPCRIPIKYGSLATTTLTAEVLPNGVTLTIEVPEK